MKLLTAEEFALQNHPYANKVEQLLIEFAKLHVKAALEACYLNSKIRVSENNTSEQPTFEDNYDDGAVTITVSKESILNAYPETLIK